MKEQTLFEKIIAGEIPSVKIYEDDDTFAFLDINPNTKGHTLVIPKKPHENIFEIPQKDLHHLIDTVQKISNAVKVGMEADGINLIMNNGSAAEQEVFHAHIHVIPRHENDKGRLGHVTYDEGEMDQIAEEIKAELK